MRAGLTLAGHGVARSHLNLLASTLLAASAVIAAPAVLEVGHQCCSGGDVANTADG